MLSPFLDKLQSKLNNTSPYAVPGAANAASGKSAAIPGAQAPAANPAGAADAGKNDVAEEMEASGTPIDVDMFQSGAEVIIFAQAPGISPEDFEITLDGEKDLLLIQGTRTRPEFPPGSKAATDPEKEGKGRFVAQECGWGKIYRKIYLPAAVDGGAAEVTFSKGILIITLPAAKSGVAKRLKVEERLSPSPPKSP